MGVAMYSIQVGLILISFNNNESGHLSDPLCLTCSTWAPSEPSEPGTTILSEAKVICLKVMITSAS